MAQSIGLAANQPQHFGTGRASRPNPSEVSSREPTFEPRLTGKVSWFEEEGNKTATGIPTSQGGIAVYNQETLGGWWAVVFPNGRTLILKQTDIGPAPWTGRVVDVAGGSIQAAGYSKSNFPTDSIVHAVYLGKGPKPGEAGGIGAKIHELFPWASPFSTQEIEGAEKAPAKLIPGGQSIENAVNALGTFASDTKKILEFLGSGEGWFRILKVSGGAILILLAFIELAKVGATQEGAALDARSIASGGITKVGSIGEKIGV